MRQYACNPVNAYALSTLLWSQVNTNFHASVPAVNGVFPPSLPTVYAVASPYLQFTTSQSPMEYGNSSISNNPLALGILPTTVYNTAIGIPIHPTAALYPVAGKPTTQKKRVVDPATLQRRTERNLRFQFYLDCLLNYLHSQPSQRCTIDEFVQAYPTLPEVVSLPKDKNGEPIIPSLTKKHRGDLVRQIRRSRDLKLTPIASAEGTTTTFTPTAVTTTTTTTTTTSAASGATTTEDESATTKGCYVELVTKKPFSQNFDSKLESSNYLENSEISPESSVGTTTGTASRLGTVICQGPRSNFDFRNFKVTNAMDRITSYSSKEDELTRVIIGLLQNPDYNPYKGTVSVKKIQNIMLSRYPELYAEVVGKKTQQLERLRRASLGCLSIKQCQGWKTEDEINHTHRMGSWGFTRAV